MNELETVESVVLAAVEKYGVPIVAEALLALVTGSNIEEVSQIVERRAIRIAADIEAQETLK